MQIEHCCIVYMCVEFKFQSLSFGINILDNDKDLIEMVIVTGLQMNICERHFLMMQTIYSDE